MSEQDYEKGPSNQNQAQNEDDGIFCQSLSPTTRTIAYYITLLAGLIGFGIGLIDLVTLSVIPLILGSLAILFGPLWIKSPSALCRDFKNPARITSFTLFIASLAATIVSILIIDNEILPIICGICLALSGIWYFLSYFPNGQAACVACLKTCFVKSEDNQTPAQAQNTEETA